MTKQDIRFVMANPSAVTPETAKVLNTFMGLVSVLYERLHRDVKLVPPTEDQQLALMNHLAQVVAANFPGVRPSIEMGDPR